MIFHHCKKVIVHSKYTGSCFGGHKVFNNQTVQVSTCTHLHLLRTGAIKAETKHCWYYSVTFHSTFLLHLYSSSLRTCRGPGQRGLCQGLLQDDTVTKINAPLIIIDFQFT